MAVIDSVTLELKNVFFFKESIFATIGNVMEIVNDTVYVFATDRIVPYKWNVYKFNLQGDSLSVLEYSNFDYDVSYSETLRENDGYLYLSGTTWAPPYDMSNKKRELVIIKSDKYGNVVKKEKFHNYLDQVHRFAFGDFIRTSDNNFIVNYEHIEKEGSENDYEYIFYVDMIKFDKNLDLIWMKNMVRVKNGTLYYSIKMSPTQDTGFYASVIIPFDDSLWLDKYIDRNVGDWPIIFYKYNKDGNVEWTDTMFNYKYPDLTFPRKNIAHLQTLKNGDLVGAGILEEPVYPPTSSFRAWLFSYSKKGHLKWEHYYQTNELDQDTTICGDLVECGNGDILGVGKRILKDEPVRYNRRRTWLFRVDSNGCYIPGCDLDTLTGVYTAVEDINSMPVTDILNIYPNPISDNITVEIPDNYIKNERLNWEIYNIVGKIVRNGSQKLESHRLYINDISHLNEGMYFIVLKRKNRMIGVGKFIKN